MGRGYPGLPLSSVGRISVEHVAAAVRRLKTLTLAQKTSLIDEIHIKQPNMLASCVVQAKFGAEEQTVEFLLNILLTCYLAMAESGYEWPVITDVEQERPEPMPGLQCSASSNSVTPHEAMEEISGGCCRLLP